MTDIATGASLLQDMVLDHLLKQKFSTDELSPLPGHLLLKIIDKLRCKLATAEGEVATYFGDSFRFADSRLKIKPKALPGNPRDRRNVADAAMAVRLNFTEQWKWVRDWQTRCGWTWHSRQVQLDFDDESGNVKVTGILPDRGALRDMSRAISPQLLLYRLIALFALPPGKIFNGDEHFGWRYRLRSSDESSQIEFSTFTEAVEVSFDGNYDQSEDALRLVEYLLSDNRWLPTRLGPGEWM